MKKITLTEQLEQIKCREVEIKERHLNTIFESIEKPTQLFKLGNYGVIKEIELQGFSIGYLENGRLIYAPYIESRKKPYKIFIVTYSEFLERIEKAEKILFVNYKDFGSRAYKYNEIIPSKGLAFNKIDLKDESERQNELYAPKENHTSCSYCRKQTPNDNLIESTIIGRGRKKTWNSWKNRFEDKACITEEKLKFCSGTCAGNEQMSREG
jgi:hypothetical protein